jgi:hypothetical protein
VIDGGVRAGVSRAQDRGERFAGRLGSSTTGETRSRACSSTDGALAHVVGIDGRATARLAASSGAVRHRLA